MRAVSRCVWLAVFLAALFTAAEGPAKAESAVEPYVYYDEFRDFTILYFLPEFSERGLVFVVVAFYGYERGGPSRGRADMVGVAPTGGGPYDRAHIMVRDEISETREVRRDENGAMTVGLPRDAIAAGALSAEGLKISFTDGERQRLDVLFSPDRMAEILGMIYANAPAWYRGR